MWSFAVFTSCCYLSLRSQLHLCPLSRGSSTSGHRGLQAVPLVSTLCWELIFHSGFDFGLQTLMVLLNHATFSTPSWFWYHHKSLCLPSYHSVTCRHPRERFNFEVKVREVYESQSYFTSSLTPEWEKTSMIPKVNISLRPAEITDFLCEAHKRGNSFIWYKWYYSPLGSEMYLQFYQLMGPWHEHLDIHAAKISDLICSYVIWAKNSGFSTIPTKHESSYLQSKHK